MKTNTVFNKVSLVVASLLVVASMLLAVTVPAFAKSSSDGTYDYSRLSDDFLARVFRHDQTHASVLERKIAGLARHAISDKLSERSNLRGLTLVELVTRSGNVALYRAANFLSVAQNAIAGPAGFDAKGNVTHRSEAIATLLNIDSAFRSAKFWIKRS